MLLTTVYSIFASRDRPRTRATGVGDGSRRKVGLSGSLPLRNSLVGRYLSRVSVFCWSGAPPRTCCGHFVGACMGGWCEKTRDHRHMVDAVYCRAGIRARGLLCLRAPSGCCRCSTPSIQHQHVTRKTESSEWHLSAVPHPPRNLRTVYRI